MKIARSEHVYIICYEFKDQKNNFCSQHVLSMFWACNFHEQSVIILWVSWGKNKCFWQRFTCKTVVLGKQFSLFFIRVSSCTSAEIAEKIGISLLESSQNLNFRLGKNLWRKKSKGTAKSIWGSSIFYSIEPKFDIRVLVDFCVFTCFYQFLYDVITKLFCRSKQKFFLFTSCKR